MAAIRPKTTDRQNKTKKRRWDVILVGTGMTVAFSIIMMKLTGYFPCDIVNALPQTASAHLNCGNSVESNFGTFFEWARGALAPLLSGQPAP